MNDLEKNNEKLQEEKTKIFIPAHASEPEDKTKIFTKEEQKDKNEYAGKPLTPEEASDAFVRHTQEEKQKEEKYIFCMECGAKNRADAKFCIRCGTPLQKAGDPLRKDDGMKPKPSPVRKDGYSDGPRPTKDDYELYSRQKRYDPGNGYSQSGSGKKAQSENLAKFICTALICISLLFVLFGHVVHQGTVMSLGSSALNAYLPDSLSEFEDEFGGDDAASYQSMSKAYNQFKKMVDLLTKDGYSSINLVQMNHMTSGAFGTLADLMAVENVSENDEDMAAAISAMRKVERAGVAGFIIELALILMIAAFSLYSIYAVFILQSAAKKRGIFCILGILDLVFLILHIVSVSAMNSAFKRMMISLAGTSEYSGVFSTSSFNLFQPSVGMLLLPLIFTIMLVVFDTMFGNMKPHKTNDYYFNKVYR